MINLTRTQIILPDGGSKLEFLFNDLSIDRQFSDVQTFRSAIALVMTMRARARQYGRDIYCHRNVAHAYVTRDLTMPQVIQSFGRDEQRALMQWLTRYGPFWEDDRSHSSDHYLECNGQLVTDTAVGEAGFCCLHGIERRLISLSPSAWMYSPVRVSWKCDNSTDWDTEVINHWIVEEFENALRGAPTPITSWRQLAVACVTRYPELNFAADSFDYLQVLPFVDGAAKRILALLHILNLLKSCFDRHGNRTPEGHRLYQDYFTGEKAWFSDSSGSEKRDFQTELTFRHPRAVGQTLFCSWHAKVKTPQLRIHFSWPVRANEPLFVVYVGPKITKR